MNVESNQSTEEIKLEPLEHLGDDDYGYGEYEDISDNYSYGEGTANDWEEKEPADHNLKVFSSPVEGIRSAKQMDQVRDALDTSEKSFLLSVVYRGCKQKILKAAEVNNVKIEISGEILTAQGHRRQIDTFIANLKEIEAEQRKMYYPKNWDFTLEEPLALIPLKKGSEEYFEIGSLFCKTMGGREIVSLSRIQNKYLMDHFVNMIQTLEELRPGDDLNRKMLFHGTRQTLPEDVYGNFDMGFDLQYANQGMFGKGLYFALNASYSHAYAYRTQKGTNIMIVADVLLGKCYKCNSYSGGLYGQGAVTPNSIKNPRDLIKPPKGYDSVESHQDTFIVYSHFRVYPLYLIEYV